MKVKIKKLHKDAVIPAQATPLAGGWDITVTEIIQEAEDFVICKLGFALELPKTHELVLVPRSSFTKTRWVLQNSPGQGDPDYFGEYQYRFRALPSGIDSKLETIETGPDSKSQMTRFLTYDKFPYKIGDRIGQVYLREIIPIQFIEVDELSDSKRGSGGFGSTGS